LQAVAATQDEQLQIQLADIRDLDYTLAATELAQRQLALSAAQKAYSKTLGNSLFDYL
jgi:flagellin-like hook-associated protein FlgL